MNSEELYDKIETIKSIDSFPIFEQQFIADFIRLDFSYAMLVNIHNPAEGIDFFSWMGNFPRQLMDIYVNEKLYEIDPLMILGRKTYLPVFWWDFPEDPNVSEQQARITEMVVENGLNPKLGIAFPINVNRRIHFGVSAIYNGSYEEMLAHMQQDSVAIWQLCQSYGHVLLDKFVNDFFAPARLPLNTEKIQILQKLAIGHTSENIASELNCSKRKIDHLVAAINKQLNAKNKTQAVSEAFQLGLLS